MYVYSLHIVNTYKRPRDAGLFRYIIVFATTGLITYIILDYFQSL